MMVNPHTLLEYLIATWFWYGLLDMIHIFPLYRRVLFRDLSIHLIYEPYHHL